MDKQTAVIADKVLADSKVIAEDVSFELPEVAFQTVEVSAMGKMEVPLRALIDNMEMSITKIGVDKGLGDMLKLGKIKLEMRWVQDAVTAGGDVKHKGCKAFVSGFAKTIPAVSVEMGSATEIQPTYVVTRYQLYYDGKEILLIDRLNHKLRVNGKDYYEDISKLL